MRAAPTVFIGSTVMDLEQHRRGLIDGLRGWVWLNVMESRGAAVGTPLSNCLRWVRESDIYIGLIGMQYGSLAPGSRQSFTELEYDEAKSRGIPRLMYMMDEEKHPILPWLSEQDPEKLMALRRFKEKVRQENVVGFFTGVDNLRYLVLRDLLLLRDEAESREPATAGRATEADRGSTIELRIDAWDTLSSGFALTPDRLAGEAESDVAAGLLAGMLERGDFSALDGVHSLHLRLWNKLQAYISVRPLDEDALARAIQAERDGVKLRLLIDLAGRARSTRCVRPICLRVLADGRELDRELRRLGLEMRPFLTVAGNALGQMPPSAVPEIRASLERARLACDWPVKKTFEKALRQIKDPDDGDNPSGEPPSSHADRHPPETELSRLT